MRSPAPRSTSVQHDAFRQGDAGRRRGVLHREGRLVRTARHQGRIVRRRTSSRSERGAGSEKRTAAPINQEENMKRLSAVVLALPVLHSRPRPRARRTNIRPKPVKIIVPYAPGGATDIVARIIGEQMRQSLGQNFVVENKPGAVRHPRHRGNGRQAGRLHAAGRQCIDQRDHAGDLPDQVQDRLREGRHSGRPAGRRSGTPDRHHQGFPAEEPRRNGRLCQAEQGQGALRPRSASAAIRTTTWRVTPRRPAIST